MAVAAGCPLPEAADGRAGRASDASPDAAGSLVLGRMDRRGLVRAKKHGTKSGSGRARPRTLSRALTEPRCRPYIIPPVMNDSISHGHAEAAEDLFFDARLTPQRRLSPRGFLVLMDRGGQLRRRAGLPPDPRLAAQLEFSLSNFLFAAHLPAVCAACSSNDGVL